MEKLFFHQILFIHLLPHHLCTDASNLGFGSTFGNNWFFGEFSSEWLYHHIPVCEFLPIVIAFELWGSCLANTTIVKHSDNAAVVHVINKTTQKTPHLCIWWEDLWFCLYFTYTFEQNIYLVFLIQLQIYSLDYRFRNFTRFPHMVKEPIQVPQSLIKI